MTIRIITLGVFALLCFAAGPSIAADMQPQGDHPRGGGFRDHRAEQDRGGHIDPARRQQLRDELMKLPPEERKAKIEALKEQMNEGRAQKLEERKAEFQSKWDNASPEQRTKFCANVQQKCASGEQGAQFACTVAKNRCEGQ